MEVDPNFAPPDPSGDVFVPATPPDLSGEITLPVTPPNPDRPSANAHAAMVVAVSLIAIAGLFFVGRWTTGGERDELANQRDAAQAERDQLQSSLDATRRELADAAATNSSNQSTIDELESAAARDSAKLASQEAKIVQLTDDYEVLEATNTAQWDDIESVGQCADVVAAGDTVVEDWDDVMDILDQIGQLGAISPDDTDLDEQLVQAFRDVQAAETDLTAASARCTAALDALPECENGPASLDLVNQSRQTPCPATD